jgi:hypothetical protein
LRRTARDMFGCYGIQQKFKARTEISATPQRNVKFVPVADGYIVICLTGKSEIFACLNCCQECVCVCVCLCVCVCVCVRVRARARAYHLAHKMVSLFSELS